MIKKLNRKNMMECRTRNNAEESAGSHRRIKAFMLVCRNDIIK